MKLFKKLFKASIIGSILAFSAIISANKLVEKSTQSLIYQSVLDIPHNKVGLLLGTSKFLSNGRINLYYTYRIEAAASLFKAGKVDFLLLSGDNSSEGYDEPTTMRTDLIQQGVPANKIYLDYAGFRTLDSIVRAKEVFGQHKLTVISQQFHNERAIYIAKRKGLKAIGFNAKGVSARYGFKTNLREKLARVKMVLNLIFGKKPKFLGAEIEIK